MTAVRPVLKVFAVAIGFFVAFAFRSCGPVRAEPCVGVSEIDKGDVADCDGVVVPEPKFKVLLESQSALNLAKAQLATCEESKALELSRCDEKSREALEASEAKLSACESSRLACEGARVGDRGEVVAWYERPVFVAGVTAVVTVVVTVLVVKVLDK